MKVKYSKEFEKSVRKLSGKTLSSVKVAIMEVISAERIEDLSNCKKLSGYNSVYRLQIGNKRAFFIFGIKDKVVFFQYLVNRGEAYNKEYKENLRENERKQSL